MIKGIYKININYGDGVDGHYPIGYSFMFKGDLFTNEDNEEFLIGLDLKTNSEWYFYENEVSIN